MKRKTFDHADDYNLDDLAKDMLMNDLKLYGMNLDQAKKIAKDLSKRSK